MVSVIFYYGDESKMEEGKLNN